MHGAHRPAIIRVECPLSCLPCLPKSTNRTPRAKSARVSVSVRVNEFGPSAAPAKRSCVQSITFLISFALSLQTKHPSRLIFWLQAHSTSHKPLKEKMTQQGDARNPTQADQSSFVFQGNTSGRDGSSSSSSETVWDRWPSLLSIRQIVTAFVLEAVTNAQPLREK